MKIIVEEHPQLVPRAFVTELSGALGELDSRPLTAMLKLDAGAPVTRNEERRKAVRDLLRHGGYKPTGRGKPASEYLLRAAGEGKLDSINLMVDACNVVSLASGWPISVVDLDLASEPMRLGLAPKGAAYVFNATGQTIDLSGLLCLFDAEGPIANAVKDCQRTKTHSATRRSLSVIWGCRGFEQDLEQAYAWHRELLEGMGASTQPVECCDAAGELRP